MYTTFEAHTFEAHSCTRNQVKVWNDKSEHDSTCRQIFSRHVWEVSAVTIQCAILVVLVDVVVVVVVVILVVVVVRGARGRRGYHGMHWCCLHAFFVMGTDPDFISCGPS